MLITYYPSSVQVMKRLFQPRKRTLLFVIRDHTRVWNLCPWVYLKEESKHLLACAPFFECIFLSNTESTPFLSFYVDSTWVFGDCSYERYREGTFLHISYATSMSFSFRVKYLFLPALSEVIISADMGYSCWTWDS